MDKVESKPAKKQFEIKIEMPCWVPPEEIVAITQQINLVVRELTQWPDPKRAMLEFIKEAREAGYPAKGLFVVNDALEDVLKEHCFRAAFWTVEKVARDRDKAKAARGEQP